MGRGEPATERPPVYDRKRLVEVVIYHQRRDDGGCQCGWGDRREHLGASFAEHIADVYEDKLAG